MKGTFHGSWFSAKGPNFCIHSTPLRERRNGKEWNNYADTVTGHIPECPFTEEVHDNGETQNCSTCLDMACKTVLHIIQQPKCQGTREIPERAHMYARAHAHTFSPPTHVCIHTHIIHTHAPHVYPYKHKRINKDTYLETCL